MNIRNLKSTRPWQHVLEAIFGYLLLCYNLNKRKNLNGEAFNFGPGGNYNYSTKEVLEKIKSLWPKKSKIKVKKEIQVLGVHFIEVELCKSKKNISLEINFKFSLYFRFNN